jgi:hypothetical protein
MAFKTEEGLGLSRQLLDLNERFEVAGFVFYMIDSQTAGSVTGFAVDERQTALGFDLQSMHGLLIILENLVVLMALGQALFRPDIVRIKTTDQHSFIFLDRLDRLI